MRTRVLQKLQDAQVWVWVWWRWVWWWWWQGGAPWLCARRQVLFKLVANKPRRRCAKQSHAGSPSLCRPHANAPIPSHHPHPTISLQAQAAARLAQLEMAQHGQQQQQGKQAQQPRLDSASPMSRKRLVKLEGTAGTASAPLKPLPAKKATAGRPPPAKKQAVAGGAGPSKPQPSAARVKEEGEGEMIIPETESDSDFLPIPRARPAAQPAAAAGVQAAAAQAAAKLRRGPMRGRGRPAASECRANMKPADSSGAKPALAGRKRARVVVSDSEDESAFVAPRGALTRSSTEASLAAGTIEAKPARQVQAELSAARRALEAVSLPCQCCSAALVSVPARGLAWPAGHMWWTSGPLRRPAPMAVFACLSIAAPCARFWVL